MNIKAVAVKEPFTMEGKREPLALVIQSRVRSNSTFARRPLPKLRAFDG